MLKFAERVFPGLPPPLAQSVCQAASRGRAPRRPPRATSRSSSKDVTEQPSIRVTCRARFCVMESPPRFVFKLRRNRCVAVSNIIQEHAEHRMRSRDDVEVAFLFVGCATPACTRPPIAYRAARCADCAYQGPWWSGTRLQTAAESM